MKEDLRDLLDELGKRNANPWPKIAREGIRLAAVFAFLYFNASNFDETEIRSIVGILLASGATSFLGEKS